MLCATTARPFKPHIRLSLPCCPPGSDRSVCGVIVNIRFLSALTALPAPTPTAPVGCSPGSKPCPPILPTTAMSEQPELKRLAPVVSAATGAATRLQGLHGRALALVPEALKPSVEQREEQLVALASPYLAALSDRAPALLHAVDARVGGPLPPRLRHAGGVQQTGRDFARAGCASDWQRNCNTAAARVASGWRC